VPTTKPAAEALFVIVNCGRLTVVVIEGTQRAVVAGQLGSPPPLTLAELVTLVAAAAVGVTGITNALEAAAAKPVATVQVTTCPAAVQPAGNVPMVKPVGIVSVIVDTAVVAALPVLVSVKV
jgi:hypothetical protein